MKTSFKRSRVSYQVFEVLYSDTLPTMPSPFRDCIDSYGNFSLHPFSRPDNGFVDSYIKVRWTTRWQGYPQPPQFVQSKGLARTVVSWTYFMFNDGAAGAVQSPEPHDSLTVASHYQSPRLVPEQFGLMAKMDKTERRLWDFCKYSPSQSSAAIMSPRL